jgi:hypothetical protein
MEEVKGWSQRGLAVRVCDWLPSNGEAQPPADGDGVLKWYGEQHQSDWQNGHDSAGRLERNVGRRLDV